MRAYALAVFTICLLGTFANAEPMDEDDSPDRSERVVSYFLKVGLPQGQTQGGDAHAYADAMERSLREHFNSTDGLQVVSSSMGFMTASLHYYGFEIYLSVDDGMDTNSILAALRTYPFETPVSMNRKITVVETYSLNVPENQD
jgi:hypothetical protein